MSAFDDSRNKLIDAVNRLQSAEAKRKERTAAFESRYGTIGKTSERVLRPVASMVGGFNNAIIVIITALVGLGYMIYRKVK